MTSSSAMGPACLLAPGALTAANLGVVSRPGRTVPLPAGQGRPTTRPAGPPSGDGQRRGSSRTWPEPSSRMAQEGSDWVGPYLGCGQTPLRPYEGAVPADLIPACGVLGAHPVAHRRGPLIPTPRLAKRLVNLYRLIKAGRGCGPSERAREHALRPQVAPARSRFLGRVHPLAGSTQAAKITGATSGPKPLNLRRARMTTKSYSCRP